MKVAGHLGLLSSRPGQSTTAFNNNSVGSKLEDCFFLFRFVRFAERRRSDLRPITPAIRTTPPARSANLNVYYYCRCLPVSTGGIR